MRLTTRQLGILASMTSAAVAAFALGWWQGDGAHRAPGAAATATDWKLPRPTGLDLSADAKILSAIRPFGAGVAAGGTVAQGGTSPGNTIAAQWRIGGIVTTETSRRLVILLRQPGQNTERTELRQIGESLPDGSVVRSVDTSSVTLERQGTIATVRMFAKN
jgi:hypothetical protein